MADGETNIPTPEGAEDWQAPEVPAEVTDATLNRQKEAASGDKLKDEAIARQQNIKDNLPDVPPEVTDATLNREKSVPDRDPNLDAKMAAGVAEMDAQAGMDQYAKEVDRDKKKGLFGRLFGK